MFRLWRKSRSYGRKRNKMACDAHPDWASHCGDLWRSHVQDKTGRDICDVLGPSPRSAGDWAAMIRRTGGRTMGDVITFVHGDPVSPRLAKRGDLVRSGWAIGICRGEDAEFFGGDFVPMSQVEEAWKVEGWRHG